MEQDFTYRLHGVGEAVRRQIPLMLAWAITIHKSQGMSINSLEISVSDAFAAGQAYVAMSRATSKKGLQIKSWRDTCVKVNAAAVKFDTTGVVDETWEVAAEREWPQQLAEALRLNNLTPPQCGCGKEARRGVTKNGGSNHGRRYWTCCLNRNDENNCGFF